MAAELLESRGVDAKTAPELQRRLELVGLPQRARPGIRSSSRAG